MSKAYSQSVLALETRVCGRCHQSLPRAVFPIDNRNKVDGLQSWCRPCKAQYGREHRRANPDYYKRKTKHWELMRNHRLALSEYEALLTAQNGVCAICGRSETLVINGTYSPLSVDHNHVTGEIRGLLCNNCNVGLGHFKDNPNSLRRAVEYLEKST